jgi:hypothetical protein
MSKFKEASELLQYVGFRSVAQKMKAHPVSIAALELPTLGEKRTPVMQPSC